MTAGRNRRRRLGRSQVMIEGFGTFGPIDRQSAGRKNWFRPAKALIERINRPASDEPAPVPLPQLPPEEKPPAEPRVILPVRPEDDELIERWLQTRMDQRAEHVTAAALFEPADILFQPRLRRGLHRRKKPWSELTAAMARRVLRNFSRHSAVPLLHVGLTRGRGPDGEYDKDFLREEVVEYANNYAVRSQPRMERYAQQTPEEERIWGPSAFRSQWWRLFVWFAGDFYDWLIAEGLRPANTNQLTGIVRFYPHRWRVIILRSLYAEVMRYGRMTPKERAILSLLANGLRRHEVAELRLEHLDLTKGEMKSRARVFGKGGRLREVLLVPFAWEALNAYLVSRRHNLSPWLFPNARTKGPMNGNGSTGSCACLLSESSRNPSSGGSSGGSSPTASATTTPPRRSRTACSPRASWSKPDTGATRSSTST